MRYANGESPKVGDRIEGKTGNLGTVTEVVTDGKVVSEIGIKWDNGVISIRYNIIDQFRLIQSR